MKRYNPVTVGYGDYVKAEMGACDDGDYIKYEEVEKLQFKISGYCREIRELETENKKLRDALDQLYNSHQGMTAGQIDYAIKAALGEAE